MLILAALILLPALAYIWLRLTLGVLVFGHHYVPKYLAFMGLWAYIFRHSPTMLTLIGLQVSVVMVWKVSRLLIGDYGHG